MKEVCPTASSERSGVLDEEKLAADKAEVVEVFDGEGGRDLAGVVEEASAAGVAPEAPEASIAKGVSSEVIAEAHDASTKEVKGGLFYVLQ